MSDEIDIESLQRWIGRTVTSHDTVTPAPVQAMRATLDRETGSVRTGEPLPPMWQSLYFLEMARQSELADNGHPPVGDFLPPVPYSHRMYAGNSMQFHHPVSVGDRMTRVSTVNDVTYRVGRSGPMVFVQVRHEISNEQGLAIIELHDIVYRDSVQTGKTAKSRHPVQRRDDWQRQCKVDSRMLFRYSALTFNTHRIHYDQPYVTEEEGYPGLLVHGPLLATLLLELLHENRPGAFVQSFRFRAQRPVFNDQPFILLGRPEPDQRHVHMWIVNDNGAACMQAEAVITNWH